jgi:NAD+ synthase (glutamine-hydrolysing)
MNLPENENQLQIEVQKFVNDPDRNRLGILEQRVKDIAKYLHRWNIDQVVLGVSGGVDSALVLAMLNQIPGLTIHAMTIYFDQYNDVFDSEYIYELQQKYDGPNIIWYDIELTKVCSRLLSEVVPGHFQPEVGVGANVSYAMRYLAFFAKAQAVGGITVGTTNSDELKYSGWFGKNSDMMVDLQPISDFYKFQVLKFAEALGVPECITTRTPTGDLLDGTSDEENFGCTYDELAYFGAVGPFRNSFLDKRFAKLIALHKKNAHKYQGQTFNPVFLTN